MNITIDIPFILFQFWLLDSTLCGTKVTGIRFCLHRSYHFFDVFHLGIGVSNEITIFNRNLLNYL